VAEDVPFESVRCCCATEETETLHCPGGGEPLVVATIEGSLEVAPIDENVAGSESDEIAVPREFSRVANPEMVVEAD
jgi:hypothetical protein